MIRTVALIGLALLTALPLAPSAAAQNNALLPVEAEWIEAKGDQPEGVRVTLPGRDKPIGEPFTGPMFGESACTIKKTFTAVNGGFDIVAKIHNPTEQPQARPEFRLRGLYLKHKLHWLDARNLGRILTRDLTEKWGWGSPPWSYPDDLYSPVALIDDGEVAVGVSLIYDLFEYKHLIRSSWYKNRGRYGFRFQLGGDKPGEKDHLLPPGATQSYTFTVRFARPENRLATLEPYRAYFRKRFGQVRYKRDLRPVFGEPTGLTTFLKNEKNPYGFSPRARLDLVGWRPYVDHLLDQAGEGYRRVMIWCPSGLYRIGHNFPCEFQSAWKPMQVASWPEQYPRLREKNVDVGFWWGRSGQISGGWNSGELETMDPDNPEHRRFAYNELDLARRRGGRDIGLDAFKHIPLWQRYGWLQRLIKDFPELHFITESCDCDIMHTIAPTFTLWRKQASPAVLADWLNPGHETWIRIVAREHDGEKFKKVVEWKMVPVNMSKPNTHDAGEFENEVD